MSNEKNYKEELRAIVRKRRKQKPLAEDDRKFHEDWGPEQCIAELRRVAEADSERFVTRNFFRNNSDISEATWNRYFGSFQEFKAQAGITQTRQQKQHERHIAKHASVEHYRDINIEIQDYAGRYERERPSGWRSILVGSDTHDIECDPFWLRIFIDVADRVQPDIVCLNGDVFDMPEFGRWNVDPREWDTVGRIQHVHDRILRPLREVLPYGQIDLICGNHEARLLRHLADSGPAIRDILSDLHGFSVSKLLGIDEFEVNFVSRLDLSAWSKRDQSAELAKNYKVYDGMLVAHHFPNGRTKTRLPGWNGHHHKYRAWSESSELYGSYPWVQLGCGHRIAASYGDAQTDWNMGFLLVHYHPDKPRDIRFEYVSVGDTAVAGGQFYQRTPEEGLRV